MSGVEHSAGPWFVATELDDPDGWLFVAPPEVEELLRRLGDGPPDTWRTGAAGAVSLLSGPMLDDEVLQEITDRIAEIFEEPTWTAGPDARGYAAVLATLYEEAGDAVMRRIRRTARGGFRLRFGAVDRMLLGRALDRLDDLLGSNDPSLARLFPNPYPDDPEKAEGWKAMVTDELIGTRREGLSIVRAMMSRSSATEDEVLQLMRTVNDTRLMLGTFLDVSEDDEPVRLPRDHPDAFLAQTYDYLGFLLSNILRALS